MAKSSKLWGGDGRFGNKMNIDLSKLNNSLSIDKQLYAEDISGSLAYAEILTDAKIIQSDELDLIKSGFKIIQREWDSGEIMLEEDDEDVHSGKDCKTFHNTKILVKFSKLMKGD